MDSEQFNRTVSAYQTVEAHAGQRNEFEGEMRRLNETELRLVRTIFEELFDTDIYDSSFGEVSHEGDETDNKRSRAITIDGLKFELGATYSRSPGGTQEVFDITIMSAGGEMIIPETSVGTSSLVYFQVTDDIGEGHPDDLQTLNAFRDAAFAEAGLA